MTVGRVKFRVFSFAGPATAALLLAALTALVASAGCNKKDSGQTADLHVEDPANPTPGEKLALAAIERTRHEVRYDSKYVEIPYPGGDVPSDTGVCTDVVVRSYRAVGIDLQQLVHEDMKVNFDKYPQLWGLKGPDTNIDHRRVPNLMTFFSRHGGEVPATRDSKDYLSGDVVAWDFGEGRHHIGLVVRVGDGDRAMVVHNIGHGPELDDCLFDWKIIGHYRYPSRIE